MYVELLDTRTCNESEMNAEVPAGYGGDLKQ